MISKPQPLEAGRNTHAVAAWAAAIAASLGFVALLTPTSAAAAPGCSLAGGVLSVTTDADELVIDTTTDSPPRVRISGGGTTLVCAGDVTSTDTIQVDDVGAAGHNATVKIVEPEEFAPGAADENAIVAGVQGEIEFNDIDMGDGGDFVELVADPAGDSYVFGASGINTNPLLGFPPPGDSNDIDIFTANVAHHKATGGAGVDTFSGQGAAGTGNAITSVLSFSGDAGNDILTGGEGTNLLDGGPGDDGLAGGGSRDSLTGDSGGGIPGNDVLDGKGHIDLVAYDQAGGPVTVNLATTTQQNTGGGGSDTIANAESAYGSPYDDTLRGTEAANELYGADGNDLIEGRGGSDELHGQAPDVPDSGTDTASYESAPSGVTVDLAVSLQTTGAAGNDFLENFENVTGSAFDDTLSGNDQGNVLTGLGGVDLLQARNGNDQLLIRDGLGDTAFCGGGADGVSSDLPGVDGFPDGDCEIVAFLAPPTAPSPALPPPAASVDKANPLCAALRAKLKKAKTKKRKRKLRRKLRRLGC